MRKLGNLLLVMAVCTLPLVANAGVLDGQSGTLFYDYTNLPGTHFETHPFTAPATVITLPFGPDLPNLIGGNTIHITFGNVGTYTLASASFNGEVFNFPGLNITSVSYSSNFTSPWGWDAHDVWVNWQGMTPDANSYVTFTVSSTPEPGSLVMFGSGIIGLAGVIRRKINL